MYTVKFVIEVHVKSQYTRPCRDPWTRWDLEWPQDVNRQPSAVPVLVSPGCRAPAGAKNSTDADVSPPISKPVLCRAFLCVNTKSFFGIFALHHLAKEKPPVAPEHSSECLAHMLRYNAHFTDRKMEICCLLWQNFEINWGAVIVTSNL